MTLSHATSVGRARRRPQRTVEGEGSRNRGAA